MSYAIDLMVEEHANINRMLKVMRSACIGILGGGCLLIALVYALKLYVGIPKIASYIHIAFTVAFLAWAFWLYHRAGKQFW